MTAEELAYVGNLAKAARATVYALEREVSLPHPRRVQRHLTAALEGARADLARCEIVLG